MYVWQIFSCSLCTVYSGFPTESARARDNFNDWAPEKLDYQKDDKISDEIKQFYYHGNTTDVTAGDKARQTSILFTDRMFITGLDKFAKLYSAHAPVFLYINAWNPEPNMALANLMSTSHKNWSKFILNGDLPAFGGADFKHICLNRSEI